jgi:hypothetical protein
VSDTGAHPYCGTPSHKQHIEVPGLTTDSFRTTCSGDCLRPFMKITSWLSLSHRDPHNGRTGFKGSGHLKSAASSLDVRGRWAYRAGCCLLLALAGVTELTDRFVPRGARGTGWGLCELT